MNSLLILLATVTLFAMVGANVVPPQPVYHQFRSQDELGGYHFGYSGGPSSRAERMDHEGVVRGAYNWVDANGNVQKFEYISDNLGYRLLSGTNVPVAPVPVVPVLTVSSNFVAPTPVEETPEVKAARAKFEAEYRKAVQRVNAVNVGK